MSLNSQNPIEIKTDKNQYNLKENDSVKVIITNTSSETIYYSTCFEKTIEIIKKDKILKTIGTPVCYCLCPAELKSGESIPVQISSLTIDNFKSQIKNMLLDESVSYRIRYSLYYDEAFGDEPVPEKFSRSNTFIVTGIE